MVGAGILNSHASAVPRIWARASRNRWVRSAVALTTKGIPVPPATARRSSEARDMVSAISSNTPMT